MFKLVNFSLVLVTLGTASVLYNLEHTTRGHERVIAKSKAELNDNAEAIKLLKAEWSSLTRPERIQSLVEQHLGMRRLEPDQIVSIEELPARLDALAKIAEPEGKATIDDILRKMQ